MTKRTQPMRLIDAGHGRAGATLRSGLDVELVPLIPDNGEYGIALRRLSELGADGPLGIAVPDEVWLHVYAYELLERMREQALQPLGKRAPLLILPFWPEALFQAADIAVHSVREIEAAFPPAAGTWYVQRPAAVIEQEARRVLGAVRFNAGRYINAADTVALENGWTVLEEAD